MYAIRSYYAYRPVAPFTGPGLRKGVGVVDRVVGHGQDLAGPGIEHHGTPPFGSDLLDPGGQLLFREVLNCSVQSQIQIRADLLALDPFIARITSYNVCYTKLLRASRSARICI